MKCLKRIVVSPIRVILFVAILFAVKIYLGIKLWLGVTVSGANEVFFSRLINSYVILRACTFFLLIIGLISFVSFTECMC